MAECSCIEKCEQYIGTLTQATLDITKFFIEQGISGAIESYIIYVAGKISTVDVEPIDGRKVISRGRKAGGLNSEFSQQMLIRNYSESRI